MTFFAAAVLSALAVSSPAAPSFEYDRKLPLDLRLEAARERDGVLVRDLSYAAAAGGRRGATLVTPAGAGPHPAILYVHWYDSEAHDSNRTQFLEEAVAFGRAGVISLLVDTMWSDREWFGKRDPARDFDSSVNEVKELRRALDLLGQQPGVDPKRIAYVGHDFGAMYGAVTAGVDHRPCAWVLIAGTKSFSDWYVFGRRLDAAARQAVIDELAPLDPMTHVAAASAPVLFQFGDKDPYVPRPSADAFSRAAREPREVRFYDAGHSMNAAAARERRAWLQAKLRLAAIPEPRQPVVARLEGSWTGEGTWQGDPARATLLVAPVLGASFTRVSYHVDAPVVFEGLAYYSRDAEGRLKGSWFDSQGAAYAIETSEKDDALEANWGPAGAPRGRTTYRLLEGPRLEVVDEVKTRDGSYRELSRMLYQREAARP